MTAATTPKSQDPLLDNQGQPAPSSETTTTTTTAPRTIPTFLVVLNLIAYIMNCLITYGIGVFGGKTNAELSRKYQTLVTPIGFAFAIWGVIFLAQLVWVLYPLFLVLTQRDQTVAKVWVKDSVGFLYLWIVLMQSAWTLVFSHEIIWLSACAMLALCGFLWSTVWALLRTKQARAQGQEPSMSITSYLLWIFPFTLHAGWVTAATAVNLNLVLVQDNATVTAQFVAAVVSLLVLFVVALWVTTQKPRMSGDRVVAFGIAWALLGVFFELNTRTDQVILERFSDLQIRVAKLGALFFAVVIAVFAALKKSAC
ncbi:hypothetical protein ACA910_015793 [Epithemia clementina (nom. ined.)]